MNTRTHETDAKKHVVVIGGGFAGLNCVEQLAAKNPDLRITLIDRNNYQQFQPLLYQVATGILSPENAAFNLRDVFAHRDCVDVVMSDIQTVDLASRTVTGKRGDVHQADYLVLAAGAEANFFGIPGVSKFAFPMYSLPDAEKLHARLLELFEAADAEDAAAADSLHFVVVGAGATGVETAGALADIIQRMPRHLYPNVDLSHAAISLVDMGSKVLPPFTEKSQDYAAWILQERGVVLRLGMSVKEVTANDVLLSDGSRLRTKLVVWAGGLKAAALSGALGTPLGRGGRVDVRPDLTLAGHPGVYALGDFANIPGTDGKSLPQLASVAQQAGRHCAANIIAAIAGQEQTPFAYVDKGIMAMVGRNAAVAELGSRHHPMTGAFAFAAWLGIHALLLTTVRAKMAAFFEWAWDYFGSVHVDTILDQPMADWAPDKKADNR